MEGILRLEQGKQYTLRLLRFVHDNEVLTQHVEKINYPTTDSFSGEKRYMQVIRYFMLCIHKRLPKSSRRNQR